MPLVDISTPCRLSGRDASCHDVFKMRRFEPERLGHVRPGGILRVSYASRLPRQRFPAAKRDPQRARLIHLALLRLLAFAADGRDLHLRKLAAWPFATSPALGSLWRDVLELLGNPRYAAPLEQLGDRARSADAVERLLFVVPDRSDNDRVVAIPTEQDVSQRSDAASSRFAASRRRAVNVRWIARLGGPFGPA